MPSLGRKYRKSKKQIQKDYEAQNSSSPSISPHPYHPASPPTVPSPTGMEHRVPSEVSHVSDITTDVLGHENSLGLDERSAVLEYSDTSDDYRGEDRYFSQPSAESNALMRNNPGESAFRTIRQFSRGSHKVVNYTSSSLDFTFEDKSDGTLDEQRAVLPTSSRAVPPPPNSNDYKYSWMTSLAYSFRSASPTSDEQQSEETGAGRAHRSQLSSSTVEFPGALPYRKQESFLGFDDPTSTSEISPLLASDHRNRVGVYGVGSEGGHPLHIGGNKLNGDKPEVKPSQIKSRSMAATVAAFYLMDYEAGRPPSLSPNFETITQEQLRLYRIQFSSLWKWLGVKLAVVLLFMAHAANDVSSVAMHTYAVIILLSEVRMKEVVYGQDRSRDLDHPDRVLVRPMIVFLCALGIESWTRLILQPNYGREETNPRPFVLATAFFKPLVLFYISGKARSALEALQRISRIVIQVLFVEGFLILSFAAVACRMYKAYDSFENLSVSWLSLFELSTTVVNPSIWMPMYEKSQSNAFFFIFFIVISVFYLHSLVLSVVFQTYIQATNDIHERSTWDREEAIRLAFLALVKNGETDHISAGSVRKALQVVRPHYSNMKIKALMDIVNPDSQHIIDYSTFRTKIRQALNASIRTASSVSTFAMGIELIAVIVAISNFVYVILLTSEFDVAWFDSAAVLCGSVITLLGLLELVIRFNPLRIPNFAPLTRLNMTFDGLALIGVNVSLIGILYYLAGYHDLATDYILMGRAIDMIRIMRFFPIFRDIVRRSSDVLPAMRGPVILVLTVLHMFVQIGMTLWGGAIDEAVLAGNSEITPLYYLNNFNSYAKGLVTMFNIFVVNDWHAVAEVFLYADRLSHPMIVYPFFIGGICSGVFIMINVLTAFFVEAFITKLGDADNRGSKRTHKTKSNDFQIHTAEKASVRKISSARNLRGISDPEDEDMIFGADDKSVTSNNSTEMFSFDVYEREGFDRIMAQVNKGSSEQGEAFARAVCDYLEIFESLAVGRERVGYMVCCQQSMNRFGNRRFQNNAMDYLKEDVLHRVVGDMHSELLVLSARKKFSGRCLVRTFAHKTDPSLNLEIVASLLRHQPAASLLVSRIRPVQDEADPP